MLRTIPSILCDETEVKVDDAGEAKEDVREDEQAESIYEQAVDLATRALREEHLARAQQQIRNNNMELALLPFLVGHRLLNQFRVEILQQFPLIGDALTYWIDFHLLKVECLPLEQVVAIACQLLARDEGALKMFSDYVSVSWEEKVVCSVKLRSKSCVARK